jgi:hypothetical protein
MNGLSSEFVVFSQAKQTVIERLNKQPWSWARSRYRRLEEFLFCGVKDANSGVTYFRKVRYRG